jgi:ATP/maltotriose-dependent transcriptional regulator MalT
MISPQTLPTRVHVTGSEPAIVDALERLLSLEKSIAVVGSAVKADVVVDESLLRDLKELSIADFISMIRMLPIQQSGDAQRHLRSVGSRRDTRTTLSERELQVVGLVAEGLSNKQISLRLKLSDKTVKNHISHVLAKLGLSARTQVAVHAIRTGLV